MTAMKDRYSFAAAEPPPMARRTIRAAIGSIGRGLHSGRDVTMVLKPAEQTPLTALHLADLIAEAGFPAGCYQTLLLPNARTPAVIEDPRIQGVTLTGSTRAGRLSTNPIRQ